MGNLNFSSLIATLPEDTFLTFVLFSTLHFALQPIDLSHLIKESVIRIEEQVSLYKFILLTHYG